MAGVADSEATPLSQGRAESDAHKIPLLPDADCSCRSQDGSPDALRPGGVVAKTVDAAEHRPGGGPAVGWRRSTEEHRSCARWHVPHNEAMGSALSLSTDIASPQ